MKSGRGGARPGAGRPKGKRNRVHIEREREIAKSGLTPLEFMLSVLRDVQRNFEDRKWAAEKAAPYVHPKLASIEQTIGGEVHHKVVSDKPMDVDAYLASFGGGDIVAAATRPSNGSDPLPN